MRMISVGLLMCMLACTSETVGEETQEAALAASCSTGQMFGSPQNSGMACRPIASPAVLAKVTIDPDAAALNNDLGFYAVHPSAALTAGNTVYISGKTGYTTLDTKGTQSWMTQAYHWVATPSGQILIPSWSQPFVTKWRPIDAINAFGPTNGYESLFQPALSYDSYGVPTALYVPGASGTLSKLNPITGEVISVINPLVGSAFDGDNDTIVNGAIAVDAHGNIAYTVVAWDHSGSAAVAPRGAWLVKVSPTDSVQLQPWSSIATSAIGVKQAGDFCSYVLNFASPVPPRPWAPTPDYAAPQFHCSAQRPSVNDKPVFTRDGKILLISTANNATSWAYLLAVDATTLAPTWSATLRDHIFDGCGVDIEYTENANDMPAETKRCRLGTHLGVDPNFNEPVAGRENGIMEVSPMVATDGRIFLGSYSGNYDNNQGHVSEFANDGTFLGVFPYGWESTPFEYRHDGTYSLVMDYNHFSPVTGDGTGPGLDATTVRLSPDFTVETTTRVATDASAVGNDFLNGQIAVDTDGNSYALNASGHVFKINRAGSVVASVDLDATIEPLSSELAWGTDALGESVLYVPFGGTMYAIGEASTSSSSFTSRTVMKPTSSFMRKGVVHDVVHPGL